jgi:hypothetical protein
MWWKMPFRNLIVVLATMMHGKKSGKHARSGFSMTNTYESMWTQRRGLAKSFRYKTGQYKTER